MTRASKNDLGVIYDFFESVKRLKKNRIVRSSKYLGDIGEYLVQQNVNNVILFENQRNENIDGEVTRGKKKLKIQIKMHNGEVGTNIEVGNPEHYDLLYIVLGPDSRLHLKKADLGTFRIYEFTKEQVEKWKTTKGRYSCAKTRIASDGSEIELKMTA